MENAIPALVPCPDYDSAHVRAALQTALDAVGGLDWVKPGMRVGVKLNLCAPMKPESAAVTHPVMAAELTRLLCERGARVVLGDSPGGPFTAPVLSHIYHATGMELCGAAGGELNRDFSAREQLFPDAAVLRRFSCTAWLLECDAVINFCKLKSHGLMGLTAGVKNLYGILPGTLKSELHYRYPDPADFANVLVDLNEFLRPALVLCDAVEVMEGNGPTQGTPRHVGALLASRDPYALDRLCARLIGARESEIPYLSAAKSRGLLSPEADAALLAAAEPFRAADFQRSGATSSWFFPSPSDSLARAAMKKGLALALRSRPALGEGCVGCGRCVELCPAHAISLRDKKAVINRRQCVRCFCCQEFCPTGAMRVHRTLLARLAQK